MIHYTPLGSHPECKDLTPLWMRRIYLIILVALLIALLHTGEKSSNILSGIWTMAIGGFSLIEAWYNPKYRTNSTFSKLFVYLLFGFVLFFGIWFIFKP